MKLTTTLIGYLNRVFKKDPEQVLALRLNYDGAMTWTVADGVLTTSVTGGSGTPLQVNLSNYTISSLCAYLAQQQGYTVPYQDTSSLASRSAMVLLDGSGDQGASNGDHIYGYTSVLWTYMDAIANELTLIGLAIQEGLLQMAASTAEGEWVDFHGDYYNVQRNQGELDAAYAARIVAEVVRARGNNVSIAEAIRVAVQADSTRVDDVTTYTTAANGTKSYGLFDVTVESTVDVPMGSTEDSVVRNLIEVMRDSGTHLRQLKYVRKNSLYTYPAAVLKTGMNVNIPNSNALLYDGSWVFNGSQYFNGVINYPP
jgi:hypothetical protein